MARASPGISLLIAAWAQVPPAVAPGVEVRRLAVSARLQRHWHLDDRQSGR
jgi:hypothetical protein